MGKKKSAAGVNKSQAIRDYLGRNPGATPKGIAAGLREEGIEVSEALAANVKYTSGRRGGKRRGRRGRPRAVAAAARRGRPGDLTAKDLLEAKKLVDQLGGIAQARNALQALEELR